MAKEKNDIFSLTERYLTEKYDLRRNTITFEVEISLKGENKFEVISFEDIFKELRVAGINIRENFLKIILKSSFVPDFNPFLSYFESLHFPEKDYIKDLCGFLEVETEPKEFYNSFRQSPSKP